MRYNVYYMVKTLFLIIVLLALHACAAHVPASETFIVHENLNACTSRSIRGYERDPCTTYRLVCYPNRHGTCVRYNN